MGISSGSGWHSLLAGTDGEVYALATRYDNLYVGGAFGQPFNNLAVLNTTGGTWSSIGSQPNSPVTCMAVQDTKLYVGGFFSYLGTSFSPFIGNWDFGSSSWCGTGTLDSLPYALATTSTKVYAVGAFTIAGTSTAVNHIAFWSPPDQKWSALGEGLNYVGRTVSVLNDEIYAGGYFTKAWGFSLRFRSSLRRDDAGRLRLRPGRRCG